MAFIIFENVGIKAVAACVPQKISSNFDLRDLIPENEFEKTVSTIGIREKRFADADVCSSDLCFKAAEKLFEDNQIDRDSIDALIFITSTPDYKQPSTAPSLQHRLGLKKATLSFDVNLACSGYVYGLSMAFSYVSNIGVDKVLLLAGETLSKTVSQKDKVTAPLFGDAGTATLIEKGTNYGKSYFSLNSDGSGVDILNMPYGGYRNPSCAEGFKEKTDTDGNVLHGEHLHMDGMGIFNFGIRLVPIDIKFVLEKSGKLLSDINIILFHQANKMMTDFLAKRIKFDLKNVPYCLEKYGNTGPASIPLTIVTQMHDFENYPNRENILMSGFGAGLSWGTAILTMKECSISNVIEY